MSVPDDRRTLAVVVPVLHDADALAALLTTPRNPRDQWVVVNGDPTDRSLDELRALHTDVRWIDSPPGRGAQLAAGVERVTAEWVVLLHADTRLPPGWRDEVTRAGQAASYEWGCFQLRLDTAAWQARLIERAVRARVALLRLPYGDQAMFFRRDALQALGGVPRVPLMEDVLLARRFSRTGPPHVATLAVTTSARRWERDGWLRRTARHLTLIVLYFCGVAPARLIQLDPGRRSHPGPPGGRMYLY
jgi:rSAM/selenodomain-associated transferase 2